ncbi:S24 family peptidase [Malaciobacter marinus]|jgi:phage repressor protein C with HTH and peptisase S24 domain|uniref:Peptidase S24-like protein n=1 Tax=Malaciobacter marinus TaxID=505249 RepID=A0AB36ZXH6_9BACT|nr:S24 family peptidase [Malaciobacter marinus]PPK62087.1 peptidase S24-like protein [Malaciobacter marinus]
MDILTLDYVDVFDENRSKKLSFSKELLDENIKESSLFVLRVDGKSMQPVINHKALVVADLSQKDIKNEKIYIVYYNNKMWIKKALIKQNKTVFVSINKDYSHLVYEFKDVHVVAKVILTFTKF